MMMIPPGKAPLLFVVLMLFACLPSPSPSSPSLESVTVLRDNTAATLSPLRSLLVLRLRSTAVGGFQAVFQGFSMGRLGRSGDPKPACCCRIARLAAYLTQNFNTKISFKSFALAAALYLHLDPRQMLKTFFPFGGIGTGTGVLAFLLWQL